MRVTNAVLMQVVVLLAGCATFNEVRREAADVVLPPGDERALGEQMRPEILKERPAVEDEAVQAYVQGIGSGLAQHLKLPEEIRPTFTVVQGDEVNAFAIPGGDVFVFVGLLREVDDEAELASVLAHELGHVERRHVAQQLVTQLGLQTIAELALGQNPGAVAQIATSVAANGYLLRYSRDAEREADQVGMQLMIDSPYDPRAMISFFDKLAKLQGRAPSQIEVFLSSHPPPADRAQTLTQQLAAAGNPSGTRPVQPLADVQRRLPPPTPAAPGDRGSGGN